MSKRRMGRRVAATAAGVIALAGTGVMVASTAQAGPVTVNYSCQTPLGVQSGDVEVTITAPATAKVGDSVKVDVTTGPTPFTTPLDLPVGSVTPSAKLKVTGAQTGAVDVKGVPNAAPIPNGSKVQLSPMTGSLALTTAGKVELAADTVTVDLKIAAGNFTIACTPTKAASIGASIQVS